MSFHVWRLAWGDLVISLFAQLASFASLSGLIFEFAPPGRNWPWWAWVLGAMAVIFLSLIIWLLFTNRPKHRVYESGDATGIRQYMHNWIRDGGRVAIWTRDMSWAHNTETQRLLEQKARRNELVLCLPELNRLASELQNLGAEVCIYGAELLECPASRFTVKFLGRDGSQVAVGRAEGSTHVIDEFTAGDHPAFYLAADLVALVRALHRNGRP